MDEHGRIRVTIRFKQDGINVPLKSLSWKKFKSDERLKQRTIDSYISFIVKLNGRLRDSGMLRTDDLQRFYWELYCRDEVIMKIFHILHEIYTIRKGHDLVMRMAPLLTCLNMISKADLPAECLAKWISLKDKYSTESEYVALRTELGLERPVKVQREKTIPDWAELSQKLDRIARSKAVDPRLRVLATIYKHGYVLRIASIFGTNFKVDSPEHNYLDLKKGIWHINHSKVRVQEFEIPASLRDELKNLLSNPVFKKGWLVPKKSGDRYTVNTGINNFTPWSKLSLPDCISCRKSFETWHWYVSGNNAEEVKKMSVILDHTPTTAVVNYTPQYAINA